MEQSTFIGYLIIGASSILSLFFLVGKPIINLNKTLVSIQAKIDKIIDDLDRTANRVTNHGKQIDDLKDRVTEVEHKQSYYETNLQAMREQMK